jgi:hypothetical protein
VTELLHGIDLRRLLSLSSFQLTFGRFDLSVLESICVVLDQIASPVIQTLEFNVSSNYLDDEILWIEISTILGRPNFLGLKKLTFGVDETDWGDVRKGEKLIQSYLHEYKMKGILFITDYPQ